MNAFHLIALIISTTTILSDVNASGRNEWVNASWNYEYYASKLSIASYESAKTECGGKSATLVVIDSAEIQKFLESMVKSGSGIPYSFFIGLHSSDMNNEFTWNDGSKLTTESYKNWGTGEPNNKKTEPCVLIGTNPYNYKAELKWNNINCEANQPKGYFCQRRIGKNWGLWQEWQECVCPGIRQRHRNCTDTGRRGIDSCLEGESVENGTCTPPSGCNVTLPVVTTTPKPKGRGDWFSNGGYQYYVSEAGSPDRSFNQSQDWCKQRDAELALVKSKEIHDFIASLVSDKGANGVPYAFFIGIRFQGEADEKHFWTDGTPLVYKNWAVGEPNNKDNEEHCVTLGSNLYEYKAGLQWGDRRCVGGIHGRKGLVCQRRIGHYWSTWSAFTGCNCTTIFEMRNRTCLYTGRSGPNGCIGNSTEVKRCVTDPSCLTTITISTASTTVTKQMADLTTATEITTSQQVATSAKGTEINPARTAKMPTLTDTVTLRNSNFQTDTSVSTAGDQGSGITSSLSKTSQSVSSTGESLISSHSTAGVPGLLSTNYTVKYSSKADTTVTTSYLPYTTDKSSSSYKPHDISLASSKSSANSPADVKSATTGNNLATATAEPRILSEPNELSTKSMSTNMTESYVTAVQTSREKELVANTSSFAVTFSGSTVRPLDITNTMKTRSGSSTKDDNSITSGRSATTSQSDATSATVGKTPTMNSATDKTVVYSESTISFSESLSPKMTRRYDRETSTMNQGSARTSSAGRVSPIYSTITTAGRVMERSSSHELESTTMNLVSSASEKSTTSLSGERTTVEDLGSPPAAGANTSIIAGVVAVVIVLLVGLILTAAFFYHKKQRQSHRRLISNPPLELDRRGSNYSYGSNSLLAMSFPEDDFVRRPGGNANSTFETDEKSTVQMTGYVSTFQIAKNEKSSNSHKVGDSNASDSNSECPSETVNTDLYATINKNKTASGKGKVPEKDGKDSDKTHEIVNGDEYAVVRRKPAVDDADTKSDEKDSDLPHEIINGDVYAVVQRSPVTREKKYHKTDKDPLDDTDVVINGDVYAVVNQNTD